MSAMSSPPIDYALLFKLFRDDFATDLLARQAESIRRVARIYNKGFPVAELPQLRDLMLICADAVAERGQIFVGPMCDLFASFEKPYICAKANEEHVSDNVQALADMVRCATDALQSGHKQVAFAAATTLLAFAQAAGFTDAGRSDTEKDGQLESTWGFHGQLLRMSESIPVIVAAFQATALAHVQAMVAAGAAVRGTPVNDLGTLSAQTSMFADGTAQPAASMSALASTAAGLTIGHHTAARSPQFLLLLARLVREMSEAAENAAILTREGVQAVVLSLLMATENARDPLVPLCMDVLWNVMEHSSAALREGASAPAKPHISALLDRHRDANALRVISDADSVAAITQLFHRMVRTGYTQLEKELRNDLLVIITLMCRRSESLPLIAASGLLSLLLDYTIAAEQGADAGMPLSNFATTTDVDLEFKTMTWSLLTVLARDPLFATRGSAATSSATDSRLDLMSSPAAHARASELGDGGGVPFPSCLEVISKSRLLPTLLLYLDPTQHAHPYLSVWTPVQRRRLELAAVQLLNVLLVFLPDVFMQCNGPAVLVSYLRCHLDVLAHRAPRAERTSTLGFSGGVPKPGATSATPGMRSTAAARQRVASMSASAGMGGGAPPSIAEHDVGRAYYTLRALVTACRVGLHNVASLATLNNLVCTVPNHPPASLAAISCQVPFNLGVRRTDVEEGLRAALDEEASARFETPPHTVPAPFDWSAIPEVLRPQFRSLAWNISQELGALELIPDLIAILSSAANVAAMQGLTSTTAAMTGGGGSGGSGATIGGGVHESNFSLTGVMKTGGGAPAAGITSVTPSATAFEGATLVGVESLIEVVLSLLAALSYDASAAVADQVARKMYSDQFEEGAELGSLPPDAGTFDGAVTPASASLAQVLQNQEAACNARAVPVILDICRQCVTAGRHRGLAEGSSSLLRARLALPSLAALRAVVLGNATAEAQFIADGGVDVLLDLIEVAPLYLAPAALTVFVDLCASPAAGVCVHAWRSDLTGAPASHMLLHKWLAEEARLGLRRHPLPGMLPARATRPLNTTADDEAPPGGGSGAQCDADSAASPGTGAAGSAFKTLRRALQAARMWESNPSGIHRLAGGFDTDLRGKLYAALLRVGFERVIADVSGGDDAATIRAQPATTQAGGQGAPAQSAHQYHIAAVAAASFPELCIGSAWDDVRRRLQLLHCDLAPSDAALLGSRLDTFQTHFDGVREMQSALAAERVVAVEAHEAAFVNKMFNSRQDVVVASVSTLPRISTEMLVMNDAGVSFDPDDADSCDKTAAAARAYKQAMLSRSFIGVKSADGTIALAGSATTRAPLPTALSTPPPSRDGEA